MAYSFIFMFYKDKYGSGIKTEFLSGVASEG